MDIAAVVVAGKEKAVIESNQKKKNQGKQTEAEKKREREIEAMDLITVQFRGHSLTIGKERHRFCEPLFDPTLLNGLPGFSPPDEIPFLPIQEVVGNVVNQLDVDQRQYVWQGLFVTGDITRHVKGLPTPFLRFTCASWMSLAQELALHSNLVSHLSLSVLICSLMSNRAPYASSQYLSTMQNIAKLATVMRLSLVQVSQPKSVYLFLSLLLTC